MTDSECPNIQYFISITEYSINITKNIETTGYNNISIISMINICT